MKNSCEQILVNKFYVCYKPFRHVETLFVQDRNLNLAGLQLVIQGLFTFRQTIAGLQDTDFYLGRIKFLHVERPCRLYSL